MRPRPILTLAVCAASCSLALVACSGDESVEAGSTATASSTMTGSPGPGAQLTPPAELVGLEDLGLETPTVVTEVEGLALTRSTDRGPTYVLTETGTTTEVAVRHLGRDGQQAWTASVPVPDGASPATAVLSQDEALGMSAVWFTSTDRPVDVDARDPNPVVGPVTWFDEGTGASGSTIPEAGTDTVATSNALTVGWWQADPTWGTPASVSVLSADGAATQRTVDELSEGTVSTGELAEVGAWNGHAVLMTVGEDGTRLFIDGAEQNSVLPVSTMTPTPSGIYLVDAEAGQVQRVTEAGVTPIETSSCTLAPDSGYTVDEFNGYMLIGQLVIAPDLSTTCLTEAIGQTGAAVTGVLSDGRAVLATSEGTNNQPTRLYQLVSADGTEVTTLGQASDFSTVGGYLVFTTTAPDGTRTVTAFPESDLEPGS